MRLRQIIAASKTNIKIGKWKSGRVSRAEFPLCGGPYNMGRSVNWCVISFEALGQEFRVLICLHDRKEIYRAILGAKTSQLLKVLCCFEFHGGEPGWHCHATCDDLSKVPEGVMRGPWIVRLPKGGNFHRRANFSVTKESAIRLAIDRYRIEKEGLLL